MSRILGCCIAVFWLFPTAFAASKTGHSIAMATGVFQQPASQYYLLYYGLHYEFIAPKKYPNVRVAYAQRPRFVAQGYADQESAANILLGANVLNRKWLSLHAYLGLGQFMGVIESDSSEVSDARRTYNLPGIHTAMEVRATKGPVYASLGHEVFTGYVDNIQLEAYVAWPVHFFNIKFGLLF